ncbi:MAG: hypothetical protein K6E30_02710 [Lachnospiraceae bacterium]|nr:hypothetical protein [Lachnospiraceae bacterium]
MKKVFVEPEMRKITVNLRESIADGSGLREDQIVEVWFRTIQAMTGCKEIIADTVPNPGEINGDPLVSWISNNASGLAYCSVRGVEPFNGRLFAAAPVMGTGSVVYPVPKDLADAYGMKY